MAVKWLINSGYVLTAANWNDNTLPQAGDICYINGYQAVVNANNTFDIGNGELRNDLCPNTGRSGGFLNQTLNNATIIAGKLVCGENHIISFANTTLTLSADLYTPTSANDCAIHSTVTTYTNTITINGNVHFQGGGVFDYLTNTRAGVLIINGNIVNTLTTPLVKRTTNGSTLTINGDLPTIESEFCNYPINVSLTDTLETSLNLSNFQALTIGGNLIINNSKVVVCDSLTISGHITYSGTNIDRGLSTSYINIINPAVFYWENTLDTPDYPAESNVKQGVSYDYGQKVGTYTPDFPQEAEVLQGVTYDNGNKTGTLTPVVMGDYPDVDKVLVGTIFDYGNKVGTFQPVADYPAEADVLQGVEYAYGQMTGTLSVATDYPQEANVLLGVEYANGSMVGTLEVVQMQADYPSEDDVRFDVPFDFGNKLGKCHVPIPEDVRDGVPVDVNDVGTLIPSSGGDRLRIADFGYYTNAQSDTYIVDLTEQDKPKFAVAEERVLIEMFPDLDLDNIADKYFDDLFVKYLKYRLIVEYYRTAGINSTFTPSEPTTEIVNYQNVRNEVWLNSANIYLKAWSKKYPESITRPQRILL